MKFLSSIAAILATLSIAPSAFGQASPGAAGAAAAAGAGPSASGADSAGGQSSNGAQGSSGAQGSNRELDAQLEAARRRLEEAARQVAELSAERGQAVMRRFSTFVDVRGRSIIGAQIENASGGAGARVIDVSPGGPAAEAGIRAGDVITSVNGDPVKGDAAALQVARILRPLKPESKVRVDVTRNGKARHFTLTTREGPGFEFFGPGFEGRAMSPPVPPAPPAPPAFAFGPGSMFLAQGPLADMELATLSPRLGSYFGTDKGILVVRAPADGALKLEDGDVILSIDGRVPTSGPHATRILASYQPGEKINLRVIRERKQMDISATMPERARGRDRVYFRSREFRTPNAPTPNAPRRVIDVRVGEAI